MRALIIGPDERADIAKLVAYASTPEHYYEPGISRVIPGDNPAFVVHVPQGFRCVFTFTRDKGSLFRHLTVSVSSPDRFPSPEAAAALAYEFGFAASERHLNLIRHIEQDGWLMSMGHAGEHRLVLVQPVAGKENS